MEKKIKVAHLTSAHSDTDIRIFHKECQSLLKAGYDVTEVTLSGTERIENGVKILSANFRPKNRFDRMRNAATQVFNLAVSVDADIYHFHDPELLRVGLKLKRLGKIVIYDTHEDTPRQILSKPYLNAPIRRIISFFFERYENYVARRMSAIVAATPFIRKRFEKLNKNTAEICNFPLYAEILDNDETPLTESQKNKICYIGGVSVIRGIKEMILAVEKCDIQLFIAGKWDDGLVEKMSQLKGWRKVNQLGFIGRDKLNELKRESLAGLVLLFPEPNHINSFPIKMFEYMSAGIPVIASNFDLWKSIIEKDESGLCVDPKDVDAVAGAINYLIDNPTIAQEMGQRGREAIISKYNWNIEEKKLLGIYDDLVKSK